MYYRILWKENSLLFINVFLKVWRMYRTHSAHTYSSILPHPPPSSSTSPPSSHKVPISLSLFVLVLGPIEFIQGHSYEPGWWGLQWRTNVSPTATPLKTVIPLAPAALDYNSVPPTGQAFPPPAITGGLRAQSCTAPVQAAPAVVNSQMHYPCHAHKPVLPAFLHRLSLVLFPSPLSWWGNNFFMLIVNNSSDFK